MTASCTRGRASSNPLVWLSAALFLIAIMAPAAAAEPIAVLLDQATVLQLPDRATTVVVGNPLIADLSIQPGGLAVITGKGYGATNFIALDRSGAVLMEKTVEVKGPSDPTVVVYRGPTRQTYSCTPDCSPRIALGDTGQDDFDKDSKNYVDFFAKTILQAATRNKQAAEAGAMASGH
ncbi:MAG TPA: pilus assembly protein N-terminal domain-containing protein [Xanthobacteraceae bacterium]|nr:pilus assembly protein N-terminal domain-containing protein [Xanthobacteraceae bacterium]